MRRDLDHRQIKVWTRAAFCCAALVLLLLGLSFLLRAPDTSPSPPEADPTPTLRETVGVAAVFGTSNDPFGAALLSNLEDLCAERGWRLIRYDCGGRSKVQQGQIEDFIRNETADVAILSAVGEQEELDARVKTLHEHCPVITVSRRVSPSARRYVAAHVGAAETGSIDALCGYLGKTDPKCKEILILLDIPDEEKAKRVRAFSAGGVTVLDENYTWGDKIYAERYLKTGLDLFPQADAIVCSSRHGTRGSLNSLTERELRSEIKIACLSYDPSMADDLAMGELDAVAILSPRDAAVMTADLLPKVQKGEKIEKTSLEYHVLTPENMDELDLGY